MKKIAKYNGEPPIGKTCTKCGEWKLFKEFYKNKRMIDGHCSHCKMCDKKRLQKYYQDNIEVEREKRKEWQRKNSHLHNRHQERYNRSEKGYAARKRYYDKIKGAKNEKQGKEKD